MARLTSPNGSTVSVADSKVDGLLARGFQRVEEKKATAKKSSSGTKKSED